MTRTGSRGLLTDPEVLFGALIIIPLIHEQLHAVLIPVIVRLPLFPKAANITDCQKEPSHAEPTPELAKKSYTDSFMVKDQEPSKQWAGAHGRAIRKKNV